MKKLNPGVQSKLEFYQIHFSPLLILVMVDSVVIAQVDAGNPWFQPVIGYSLPVFVVILLTFFALWAWSRWQENGISHA